MKVCIIGNGGREHALAWKLHHSPSITDVYVVPGNAGMTSIATVVNLDWRNRDTLLAWLLDYKIDLVVIGPELPLVEGLSDAIRAVGIPVGQLFCQCLHQSGDISLTMRIDATDTADRARHGQKAKKHRWEIS